jgi:polyhydroxyalkanoate synthesis regulator phasin
MAPKTKRGKTAARTTSKTDELDVARKIWLAGVGAYGRIFEEAQGQAERLANSANEMFDELVQRGETIEDDVRSRISKTGAGARVVKFVERAQRFGAERRKAFAKRVAAVRESVSETLGAPMNLTALTETVQGLVARVETLTGVKTGLGKAAGKATKRAAKVVKAVVRKGRKAKPTAEANTDRDAA